MFFCLGTPIQNSVKDLWSLISFLKLKPFTDQEWWHRTIQRPVTMGATGGLGYEGFVNVYDWQRLGNVTNYCFMFKTEITECFRLLNSVVLLVLGFAQKHMLMQ